MRLMDWARHWARSKFVIGSELWLVATTIGEPQEPEKPRTEIEVGARKKKAATIAPAPIVRAPAIFTKGTVSAR